MKKKRKGNDIRVNWAIVDGAGHEYNLEGKNLILSVMCHLGDVPYGDLTIEGNVISFTVFGKDQRAHGRYSAMLVENRGEEGMKTLDIADAFELVPYSNMEGGSDRCSHLSTETVDLLSEVVVGVPGPRGFSLYDYAVKYYGFPGTELEFWLWYKHAKDAADTAAGNAAAAQASIEESERARAAEFARLSRLIEEAVSNADSLVDRLRTFPTVFADELPEASVDTLYSFYLVPNPLDSGVKDIYLTEKKQDGTYGWRKVGGTNISFQEYLRKDDVVYLSESAYDALVDAGQMDMTKQYNLYED